MRQVSGISTLDQPLVAYNLTVAVDQADVAVLVNDKQEAASLRVRKAVGIQREPFGPPDLVCVGGLVDRLQMLQALLDPLDAIFIDAVGINEAKSLAKSRGPRLRVDLNLLPIYLCHLDLLPCAHAGICDKRNLSPANLIVKAERRLFIVGRKNVGYDRIRVRNLHQVVAESTNPAKGRDFGVLAARVKTNVHLPMGIEGENHLDH